MVDESTTMSRKACLVINLRAFVEGKTSSFFLDLVELESTDAKSITDALLTNLAKHGFTHEYLSENLICFASDGASVMTGSKSGVATSLQQMYPAILLWHCCNHRLELAVGDAVSDVSGSNAFKIFLDSVYALYSMSPKNQTELKKCAAELEGVFSQIGRVLDTRWAASSLRTVMAVWKSFPALAGHFSSERSRDASKFKGLHKTLTSRAFVHNLAIMIDALTEISHLSLNLQKRDTSLVKAHRLIKQTISSVEGMVDKPGKYQSLALEATEAGILHGVTLRENTAVKLLNTAQFFRSLADSLKSRMLTVVSHRGQKQAKAVASSDLYKELLSDLSVLDSSLWPVDFDEVAAFGEASIENLATRFSVDVDLSVKGFKLYKAGCGKDLPYDLKPIDLALQCVPVSTAECERSFSVMNSILTDKRNRLEIPTLQA
jgi:hypothetical protein